MTLDNLQYALYLNNRILLDRIKALKNALDDIVSTDIEDLKQLINDINTTEITNLKNLINDLDTDLSNHIADTVVHVTQNDKDLWNATLQNAKDYAKKLFDGVTSFTIEIVDELPIEDIKPMTIYFIRNGRENEGDYYEEHMYINDKWEIIGSTFVNLSPYLLKEDFEKYKQEISDKFLKYNTSDEIANILKNYLLASDFNNAIKNYVSNQTFNDTIKKYTTTEALNKILEEYAKTEDIHTHENKTIIDKLSESADGNLLFNGQEIKGGSGSDITISEEENNAIQQKDDGIFVEDKTEQINNLKIRTEQINIAQKTSFEKSYTEDILYSEIINSTGTFKLTNNVHDYDEIVIKHSYTPEDGNQFKIFKVSELEYDSNVIYQVNHGNGSALSYVSFKFINNGENIQVVSQTMEVILKIIGIKYNTTTIDPVEYINTTNGIEDTPVGHIITHMGNNAPKHYLICDGTEYNITDYPYLVEHFKTEFGSYNYFGGDGINTFCVPDLRGEFLRGTGTNNRTNQGNGGNVGEHQDATEIPNFYTRATSSAPGIGSYADYQGHSMVENADFHSSHKTNMWIFNIGEIGNSSDISSHFSSRPTNTSVLYCIKYEPTYYMRVTQTVSLEEANELKEQNQLLKEQNQLLQQEILKLENILDSINRVQSS